MSNASMYVSVDQIDGKHDVKELKRELDSFAGVTSVSVNDRTDTIAVDFDTTAISQERLQKRIEQMGFQITHTRLENPVM